jgi:hypothetical protein
VGLLRIWTRSSRRLPIPAGGVLDSLNEHNGQTLGELCGELDMARQL